MPPDCEIVRARAVADFFALSRAARLRFVLAQTP